MSSVLQMGYADKPEGYFDGARHDIVALMPPHRDARVLEIGCGNGANGVLAKREGKAGYYVGVELNQDAAREASEVLDLVHVGDAEVLDFDAFAPFDIVIMSEVLEHLVDPWALLARLRPVLKDGAKIFASSPNIANITVLRELLRGDFDYMDAGVMDRTHLRWFTPKTYAQMFEQVGFTTLSVTPIGGTSWKWKVVNLITGARWGHLAHRQMLYVGQHRVSALPG